nr:immunoglobulin heavy chain junction region [Macaca mulatta]MOY18012.1 immunoglobulin heavy chain junction region [Macaca mulatta]MOY18189.1 immunoglobulin heavy chain junction region [Macaca mulatta]MOY18526.1 immunoglobulin heavy chain junction region [Macaca mulatta]MOY19857.1 immunoglobulin heavy chain junction region [Macaca mulatta]
CARGGEFDSLDVW